MRKLGIVLMAIGVLWGLVAFNMQTTVVTEGKTFGSGQFAIQVPRAEVNNIGLLDNRRNHLMLAGLLVVAGVLLYGFGTLSKAPLGETGNRKCPYCAELVKAEAIKCRHCNSDIPPLPASQTTHPTDEVSPSYIKPLPITTGGLPRLGTAHVLVAVSVMAVWILLFPTTKEIDHLVCRAVRTNGISGDFDTEWQESMKRCMAVKRLSLKPEAISEMLAKNAALAQDITEAKVKMAELNSQPPSTTANPILDFGSDHIRQTNKEVQQVMISSHERAIKFNATQLYLNTNNWE
jgi:hypothetical protein